MRPDPTVLAFDTSAAHCAAALLLPDGTVTHSVEDMARGQGERLLPLLENLLERHNLGWGDLDAIGVGTGPGNFTGIRISVSAARGLALALDIPAVGVSMFDTTQRLAHWPQTAVPAPRDQIYLLDPDRMQTPVLTTLDDAEDRIALSSAFDAAAHVRIIALIAAERARSEPTAPKPLYVKPADAAPPREKPPVILP